MWIRDWLGGGFKGEYIQLLSRTMCAQAFLTLALYTSVTNLVLHTIPVWWEKYSLKGLYILPSYKAFWEIWNSFHNLSKQCLQCQNEAFSCMYNHHSWYFLYEKHIFFPLKICGISVLDLDFSSFFNWTKMYCSPSFLIEVIILTMPSLINPVTTCF